MTDKATIIKLLKKVHIKYIIDHNDLGGYSIEAENASNKNDIHFEFDKNGDLIKIYCQGENKKC